MTESIGDVLRARRIRLGWTQEDLAAKAGVSVRSVRNLERGAGGTPRPQTLQRLASAVGLSGLGDAEPAGIHIDVLGPLTVHAGGREVPIPSPMQRRLLGLLALNPGQVVSTADIVEVLWEGRPPATHPNLIHVYVGALRKSLDPAVIVTGVNGYRLGLDRDRIDRARFDDLVKRARSQGRSEDAYDVYEQALRCWRGPIDPAFQPHPAAAAATHQRIVATLAFADAAIDLRRYDAAMRWLDPLSRAEPLHEGLHARLLLALAGAGQQAEALRHFAAVRTRIVEELGVEPGPQLTEAHLRVLRQELPGAPAPVGEVVPAELPVATSSFIGRSQALRSLDRLLPGPAAAIAAISGGPGTGKTALAVHWGHSVRRHFPGGQLYVNLRGFHPTGPVVTADEAMRTFLESLGVAPRRIPQSPDGRVNLYRSLLAARRVLVVLDNARDAEHVRPLLPGSAGSAAVVTSRNRLTGLVAFEGVTSIGLEVLSPADAHELVSRRLGADRLAAEPGVADEIGRLCGRLPLALAILTARATVHAEIPLASFVEHLRAERDRLDTLRGDEETIDIRAVFSWSYGVLSPAAARLFRLLGAHAGPDIGIGAAASLAGATVDEVRAPLAELVRGSLIEQQPNDRYTVHDLLRVYALELAGTVDTAEERRAATLRMLDHYLSSAYGASLALDPFRGVTTMPGRPPVDPQPSEGPAEAAAWFAAERPNLLAAVTDMSADPTLDDRTWWLGWTLCGHLQRSGHWQEWEDVQRVALEVARRLGDIRREAFSERNIGVAFSLRGRFEEATACHQRALDLSERIDDPAGAATAHVNLAWAADRRQDYAVALHHAELALPLYQAVPDRSGEADAINTIGWYRIQLGDFGSAIPLCHQALAIYREIDDRTAMGDTWDTLGYAYHHLDRHEEALVAYREALVFYEEATDLYHQAFVLNHMGDTQHAAGDVGAAAESWRAALRIFDDLGHADAAEVRGKLG